jgi:hypothetical protein
MMRITLPLNPTALTFSGHETFILRSNWLKKAYDLLRTDPELFYREDAFVSLGVGKNMAQSIRHWGRVCNVFQAEQRGFHRATWLGEALFDDETGWDPFLVTVTSRWLLHYQLVSRPEAAFTWYYTFNVMRRGEFTATQLAGQICDLTTELGGKSPSLATINRDIDCFLRCYLRPNSAQLAIAAEDTLHCPLHELDLIQQVPGQPSYRLVSAPRVDLADALVAYAALQQARALGRSTVAFNELAYGERSPGRIFRIDEDALLARLLRMETVTGGQAVYAESGGIRQLAWRQPDNRNLDRALLDAAFAQEGRHA